MHADNQTKFTGPRTNSQGGLAVLVKEGILRNGVGQKKYIPKSSWSLCGLTEPLHSSFSYLGMEVRFNKFNYICLTKLNFL